MIVVRAHWTMPRLLPFLAAGGLLLGAVVWWLSNRLRGARRPRRLVIAITILAAILVPGSFFPRVYALGKQAPPSLLLVAVGLPTILTMLIFMGVRAASTRESRTLDRLRLIGPIFVGVVGVLYYRDGLIRFPSGGENPLIYLFFILPMALSVPAAVVTIMAIRGRPAVARPLWQRLLLIPALLGAGYAFTIGAVVASLAISWLVLFPMEYGQTYDGVAFVPGSVAIGLLFGFLAGLSLDSTRPTPTPAPVTDVVEGHFRLGETPG
jgi:hypothetical protein